MINQVRFSRRVRFFEQDFCKRWNTTTYKDLDAPCLFAGCYRQDDVDAINNHKGFKLVWNNGRVRSIFNQLDSDNLVVLKYTDCIDHSSLEGKYKMKQARFEIKDYSLFQPNKLGDCICVYLGNESGKYIMGYDEVEKLRKLTKRKILVSMLGKPREQLKAEIYDKCFIYFRPIIIGGIETSIELALMGRKTLSNSKGEGHVPYNDLEDACRLIEEEAKWIGKERGSVLMENYFDTGEEWKLVKFWQS